MATLPITIAANANAGSTLRKLGQRLQELSMTVPDNATTGASTVLTVDNAPATGVVAVQLTAGPYQSANFIVG
jgi:hypothetical protein